MYCSSVSPGKRSIPFGSGGVEEMEDMVVLLLERGFFGGREVGSGRPGEREKEREQCVRWI